MPTERHLNLCAIASAIAGICAVISSPAAPAQNFPQRPLRMIVPWAPAGAADILARTLAQKMGENWSQQVVVDNRPGANGIIGTELAARAPADGYTMLMGATGPNSVLPSLVAKLPYDALKDFAPVSLVATTTYVLSVNPSLPVNSVRELVALAKSKPGQITLAFENIAPVLPHIKSGRLKALAISAPKRSALLPDVPTVAESGFPGFQAVGWFGLLVPGNTPHSVIGRLNNETVRILKLPDVRERLLGMGAEIHGSTPEDFAAFEKSEIEKWAKVVKNDNVRLE